MPTPADIANESIDMFLNFQIIDGVLNVYQSFMGQFFVVIVLFIIFISMQMRFNRVGPAVVFGLVGGSIYFDLLSGPFKMAAWILLGIAAVSIIWKGINTIVSRV